MPVNGPDPDATDEVMLVRSRLSRIYYLRKFFNYPITLNLETVEEPRPAVGMVRIGASYLATRAAPVKPERSLEDFFINRFGRELYAPSSRTTPRRSGACPATQIEPEWGAQRVKGLSVTQGARARDQAALSRATRPSPRKKSRPA